MADEGMYLISHVGNGTRMRLHFSPEELVEVLEGGYVVLQIVDVDLVEANELGNMRRLHQRK